MLQPATRFAVLVLATACAAVGQSANLNTIVGAGYASPTSLQVAPGQVLTIYAAGVGSNLTQPVYAGAGTWPTTLAGISVTILQGTDMLAPILAVSPVATCPNCGVITAITVQIPYTLTSFYCPPDIACPAILVLTELFVSENGVAGTAVNLTAMLDQVHIVTVCDSILPGGQGLLPGSLPCQPEVTHANGQLVSNSNPATVGEELVAYAVGLGATNPVVPAGQAAAQPTPTTGTFLLDFNYHADALASKPVVIGTVPTPLFTGLTPGFPGLYQINFVVPPAPAGAPPCLTGAASQAGAGLASSPRQAILETTNLTVSVGGSTSFDGAAICVTL